MSITVFLWVYAIFTFFGILARIHHLAMREGPKVFERSTIMYAVFVEIIFLMWGVLLLLEQSK